MSAPAARRYARAVFELAVEGNIFDRAARDFQSVADCVTQSEDLRRVLTDPRVAPEARKSVMEAIVTRLGVAPMVKNAVLLVAEKRRAALIPDIAEELGKLADEREGRVRAEVLSAQALSDAQATRLTGILEKITGRKVTLVRKVDPNLIGGVVTRIGDRVFDGSVKNRLSEIRHALLS